MRCEDCKGEGFKEYDAGLLVIGCKACSGTGKVDEALTKEEFERAYAFRSDMTPDQVTELGLIAMPDDCVEGWAMEKAGALTLANLDAAIATIQATNRQALIATINNMVGELTLDGTEDKPYLHVELECEGSSADYATEADVPYQSVPCACGNPDHWLIKYEEETEEANVRVLKPGEYVCAKCEGKIHREKSGLGKKHWDFRR